MSGYDKSLVIGWNDKDLNEFCCGICQDVLNDPVVTQCCRQTYCWLCIEKWLKDNNTCPHDRSRLTSAQLQPPPRMVINVLNNIDMKCVFHLGGCDKITKLEKFNEHVATCTIVECNSCGEFVNDTHNCVDLLKAKNVKLTRAFDELAQEMEAIKISTYSKISKLKKENDRLKNESQILLSEVNRLNADSIQLKSGDKLNEIPVTFPDNEITVISTKTDFDAFLLNAGDSTLVVIFLYKPSSFYFREISPQFEQFAKIYQDVKFVKIDIDNNPGIVSIYMDTANTFYWPSFILVKRLEKLKDIINFDDEILDELIRKYK